MNGPPPPAADEPPSLGRALCAYLCGIALVAGGAGASSASGSWLPLALAASAALMLTWPLVKALRRRGAARRRSAGSRR